MAGGNPHPSRGRQVDDFYPTPVEVTEALVEEYGERLRDSVSLIWEPCAGNGAMTRVLERIGVTVVSSDLNPRSGAIIGANFLNTDLFDHVEEPFAIITNPPFNLAEQIIRRALSFKRCEFLALVLKSSFWHAKGRQKLFAETSVTAVHPLTWRPDFLGIGRPTMEAMWCVWRRENGRPYLGQTHYIPINKSVKEKH